MMTAFQRVAVLAIGLVTFAALPARAEAPIRLAASWLELLHGGSNAGTPLPAAAWKRLEAATWIGDGSANAPRVVYAFTDPNCPLCSRFWSDARPWVDSGEVQLRHVMVAVIDETSAPKAAALLSAKDPSIALVRYETHHGGAIAAPVDGALRRKLDANESLMRDFGAPGTPAIVYRDAAGVIRRFDGAPPEEMLSTILGPR
jgi:thiol:disulfide interchange protein DsbG